jgi:RND family efflux transporter MFP subunit
MKAFCKLPMRTMTLFIFSLALGCSKTPATDARLDPPRVLVSKAASAVSDHPIYTGLVTARVESNIGFRVSGKVIERLVDIGQEVRKGQILMRLDRNDLALNYSAQAAAVATAKAKYTQAIADEARLNGLSEQGAISAQTYDAAKAGLDAASAALEAAKAQAHQAKNAESYADLLADADGIIIGVFVEPGQVITSSQVVMRLAKNGSREAEVHLPETVRPATNSEATAMIYGEGLKKYNVRLRELSKAADPVTRTFTARYIIPDSASIPLGSTISIELNETGEKLLQVPLASIYANGSATGVWIVNTDDSSVSLRKVSIKQISSEFAFVEGDISQDEQIVALGAHLLHEGEQVKISDINKVVLK